MEIPLPHVLYIRVPCNNACIFILLNPELACREELNQVFTDVKVNKKLDTTMVVGQG